MTECTILKNFPFSRDGFNIIQAVAGDPADIPDDLIAGLVADGYVSLDEAKALSGDIENKRLNGADENKNPEPTDIPDDWRNLGWNDLKSLASKVSDDAGSNKEDAIAAIELEVERRANAAGN